MISIISSTTSQKEIQVKEKSQELYEEKVVRSAKKEKETYRIRSNFTVD